MRLLLHNLLQSHVKGVKQGYPLVLNAVETEEVEAEFNAAFIVRMLPRINWGVLSAVAAQLDLPAVPAEPPADAATNEAFLQLAHHVLLEVDVVEGTLVCPESGRVFPIANGIPNLLLNDEEAA